MKYILVRAKKDRSGYGWCDSSEKGRLLGCGSTVEPNKFSIAVLQAVRGYKSQDTSWMMKGVNFRITLLKSS